VPEAIIPLSRLGDFQGTQNDFNGATFMVNVPDGQVDTFMNELNSQTRSANLRGRVINNG